MVIYISAEYQSTESPPFVIHRCIFQGGCHFGEFSGNFRTFSVFSYFSPEGIFPVSGDFKAVVMPGIMVEVG